MYLCGALVDSWSVLSWQHLRTYEDKHRLVTMRTDGDFIVLLHWETKVPVPWSNIPLSHFMVKP